VGGRRRAATLHPWELVVVPARAYGRSVRGGCFRRVGRGDRLDVRARIISERRLTSDGRCLPSYDLVSREVLRDTAF
jgi:hypothetical protein